MSAWLPSVVEMVTLWLSLWALFAPIWLAFCLSIIVVASRCVREPLVVGGASLFAFVLQC